jgi:hypothetical protein|tara:strand:+ start:2130 stop:2339 length:210 start_codon:yes stop_codon:yes gene_type:complete
MKITQNEETGDVEVYFTRPEFKAIRKHKKLVFPAVRAKNAINNVAKVLVDLNEHFPEDIKTQKTTSEDI